MEALMLVRFLLIISLFFSTHAVAQAINDDSIAIQDISEGFYGLYPHNKPLLRELRNLAQSCVTEYHNKASNQITGYRLSCNTLQWLSLDVAYAFINNEWLKIISVDSKDTDGGDLNNMIVYNSKNEVVAYKRNVVAFRNVLLAMAGGHAQLHTVEK